MVLAAYVPAPAWSAPNCELKEVADCSLTLAAASDVMLMSYVPGAALVVARAVRRVESVDVAFGEPEYSVNERRSSAADLSVSSLLLMSR